MPAAIWPSCWRSRSPPRAVGARLDADDHERLREFLRAYGDLDRTRAYQGSFRAGYASGGMTSPGVKKPVRDFSELLDANFWRESMHWGELADQAAPMMQPVGGMDRIIEGFMGRVGDMVELRAAVREIRLGETGVEVAYTGARGEVRAVRADYCLNSMPAHLVVGLRHNLPPRYVRALSAPGRGKLFKLAFQAQRRSRSTAASPGPTRTSPSSGIRRTASTAATASFSAPTPSTTDAVCGSRDCRRPNASRRRWLKARGFTPTTGSTSVGASAWPGIG